MQDWTDLQGQQINPFIENYRKALEEQRDASLALAEQGRANQQQAIMSGANRKGMLYSTFPARQKIRYDANTYYPGIERINTSYATGLDTLRNNATGYYNQIEELKKNIANLNKLYAQKSSS